jgi:HD-GYP domain-containing protein (c-di-GMP phosphodiesterase class II)
LVMFERIAVHFQATGDPLSQQMALDNAAIAALRLGNFEQGIALAERAAEIWPGEAKTARDFLLVVQGASLYCELLIQVDRLEEATASARLAHVAANRSGLAQARMLADIALATSAFSLGTADGEAVEQVISRAAGESPTLHFTALEIAIRSYEHAGELDRALMLQYELLAFNKKRKFEEVRRALGRPSPEEAEGTARLARLGTEVDRKVADLTRVAIDQALRSGFDIEKVFRVGRLAQLFATHEGLPQEKVRQIGLAGKLIDIGTIILPDDLVSRSRELSVGERRIVEKHADFGADLLSNARLALLQPCVSLVRFHHERWDGAGPCALKGDAIPLESRVISLCDVFEALRHDRPWRSAYSTPEALRVISERAGTQFDPVLTARFVGWLQEHHRSTEDFEGQLEEEAQENDYVRMRKRISRLVSGGHSASEPRAA